MTLACPQRTSKAPVAVTVDTHDLHAFVGVGAFPELSGESHAKIVEFVKKWGF